MHSQESKGTAPDPSIMREQFIKVITNKLPKAGEFRAAQIVDEILEKQIMFYAQMADAELDATDPDVVMAIGELNARAAAVIVIGARYTQYMPHDEQLKWQSAAAALRNVVARILSAV